MSRNAAGWRTEINASEFDAKIHGLLPTPLDRRQRDYA